MSGVQVSLALENISAQYSGFEGRIEMQGKAAPLKGWDWAKVFIFMMFEKICFNNF